MGGLHYRSASHGAAPSGAGRVSSYLDSNPGDFERAPLTLYLGQKRGCGGSGAWRGGPRGRRGSTDWQYADDARTTPVVRNNSLVPRHTHDVEPAAHRFSIVPPPTPSSSRWGVTHGLACKPRISTWNFRYLPSRGVEPSSRLRGAACEFVELCKHLVQHRCADVADPLLHTTAIDGPYLKYQRHRDLQQSVLSRGLDEDRSSKPHGGSGCGQRDD
jgi:hypothetical protein